jgi:hypothetical protein
MKRSLLGILPLLAAVAATRMLGSMILPIYDDAFITFRYARNLTEQGVFVYNPGEWILGTTAPAFGLLSSLFYFIGLPMPASIPVLNLLIDVALAYLIYRLVRESFSYTAAVVAVLFFAVSPILIRISVGGMEANLFVLIVLMSLLLYRRKRPALAIVVASLSYFLRPEGALLALYLIGNEAITRRYGAAIKYAALSLLTTVPGLLLIYFTYGSFISHSVIAKAGEHLGIVEVFRRLVIPEPASIAYLVVTMVGIREVWKAKGVLRSYFGFVLLYLAAYLIMRPWIWSWYAMPVQVALAMSAGISVVAGANKFSFFTRPAWERLASVGGTLCVVGVWAALFVMKGSTGVTEHVYGELATSGLQHGSILATDIGVVGYYSDARIYDGLGLVTPEALDYGSLDSMIMAKEPDALFLNTSKHTQTMMSGEYFEKKYRFARRFSPTGATGLPADTSAYSDGWQADYLLYVKR